MTRGKMLLKTLLNMTEKYSSFVYKKVRFDIINLQDSMIIEIIFRVGGRSRCPECRGHWSMGKKIKLGRSCSSIPYELGYST
jgi:hypothetical protein